MAEFWDVYTADRLPTGRLHRRGDPIPDGEYHLVVNVWTVSETGKFLLTQRSPEKPFAGYWECTGGSVVAGEDSYLGALREAREETGLSLRGTRPYLLCSEQRRQDFLDTWLFFVPGEPVVTLQEGETVDYRWVTAGQYRQMEAQGLIVPSIKSFPLAEYAAAHWRGNGEC